MKKIALIVTIMFLTLPILVGCREEGKEVEVQELRDDVPNDNSSESTYNTNPTENDPD
ncbi:hypothetical protein [Nonlabens sp.]|uniref:hypothetical protein n=1 Tax=Nonlabens sp. TaxID=1888209 RepID=UPI003F695EE9